MANLLNFHRHMYNTRAKIHSKWDMSENKQPLTDEMERKLVPALSLSHTHPLQPQGRHLLVIPCSGSCPKTSTGQCQHFQWPKCPPLSKGASKKAQHPWGKSASPFLPCTDLFVEIEPEQVLALSLIGSMRNIQPKPRPGGEQRCPLIGNSISKGLFQRGADFSGTRCRS